MKKYIEYKQTTRLWAYQSWKDAKMPLVTVVKTFDITHLLKVCKNKNMKPNMLMLWCIIKAASQIDELYQAPDGDKMARYDSMAIQTILKRKDGGLIFCDVPFENDLDRFSRDYTTVTKLAIERNENHILDDRMTIWTSAIVGTEIDCIVNQYIEGLNNPFMTWGRFRKGWFKTTVPISIQFHHVQMDGEHVAKFLNLIQAEMKKV